MHIIWWYTIGVFQDLEMERQAKRRLEKDLKKISEHSDEDKNRQKQIVLLLLAERKKIVMKYIEERKRSEDLAQVCKWLTVVPDSVESPA